MVATQLYLNTFLLVQHIALKCKVCHLRAITLTLFKCKLCHLQRSLSLSSSARCATYSDHSHSLQVQGVPFIAITLAVFKSPYARRVTKQRSLTLSTTKVPLNSDNSYTARKRKQWRREINNDSAALMETERNEQ
jgi:hypothetical protein